MGVKFIRTKIYYCSQFIFSIITFFCTPSFIIFLKSKTTVSLFFFAEYTMWLNWLFTLNSCLNPWIYMFFNPELIHNLCGRRRYDSGRHLRNRSSFIPHKSKRNTTQTDFQSTKSNTIRLMKLRRNNSSVNGIEIVPSTDVEEERTYV